MADELATKVVIEQTVLRGSNSGALQRIAVVYIEGREYRVSAPPEAKGEALEWMDHVSIRQLVDFNSEEEIHDALGVLALKEVKEELARMKRDTNRSAGMNPDGLHSDAQICLKGHVQHCDGTPFDPKTYCSRCGSSCIDECPHCQTPIRGRNIYSAFDYTRPSFCHGCGRPYPWMEERLKTARELLDHDDKLSLDERKELWDDLQYVMSDPRADLAPAKKALINIKLGKAGEYTKEIVLDLIAKIAVESMKP
jgi:hypothetical protein